MGKRSRAPPRIAFPGGNSSLNPRVSLRGGMAYLQNDCGNEGFPLAPSATKRSVSA